MVLTDDTIRSISRSLANEGVTTRKWSLSAEKKFFALSADQKTVFIDNELGSVSQKVMKEIHLLQRLASAADTHSASNAVPYLCRCCLFSLICNKI